MEVGTNIRENQPTSVEVGTNIKENQPTSMEVGTDIKENEPTSNYGGRHDDDDGDERRRLFTLSSLDFTLSMLSLALTYKVMVLSEFLCMRRWQNGRCVGFN